MCVAGAGVDNQRPNGTPRRRVEPKATPRPRGARRPGGDLEPTHASSRSAIVAASRRIRRGAEAASASGTRPPTPRARRGRRREPGAGKRGRVRQAIGGRGRASPRCPSTRARGGSSTPAPGPSRRPTTPTAAITASQICQRGHAPTTRIVAASSARMMATAWSEVTPDREATNGAFCRKSACRNRKGPIATRATHETLDPSLGIVRDVTMARIIAPKASETATTHGSTPSCHTGSNRGRRFGSRGRGRSRAEGPVPAGVLVRRGRSRRST